MFPPTSLSGSAALELHELHVDADTMQRALRAARLPTTLAGASPPGLRELMGAARDAARELGCAPRPELLQRACIVRFDSSAWPVHDAQRCVLVALAAHWLGVGQPFGWIEQGPSVFAAVEPQRGRDAGASAAAGMSCAFRTAAAALRPAFQPEVVSLAGCVNRAQAGVGLVDAAAAFAALPRGLAEVARQEVFGHCADPGWGPACQGLSEPRALVRDTAQGVMAALDLACTRPLRAGDAAAHDVLLRLGAYTRAHATWLSLQPADVLFLRNARVLHALRATQGPWRMLRGYWRQSLLALGNFAATGTPGLFRVERAWHAGVPR